jgi:hypothetical protein
MLVVFKQRFPDAKLYVESLLPRCVEDCILLCSTGRLHFQQEGGSAQRAKLAQDWIATNCSGLIGKEEWAPKSSDLNSLEFYVLGAMLERYKAFHLKPKNIEDVKKVLLLMWDQLSHDPMHKAILTE